MFTHFIDFAHIPKKFKYNLLLKFRHFKSAHAHWTASSREIIEPHMPPELPAIRACRTFEFSPKNPIVPRGEFKIRTFMFAVVFHHI